MSGRPRLSRRLVVLALLLAVPPSPTHAAEPLPLPTVQLDAMEPGVRARLQASRETLEALAPDAPPTTRATAYGAVGQIAFFCQLTALAEAAFRNAETLAPEDYRWPYYLGALYQEDGRLDAALEALGCALRLRPGDVAATVRTARILLLRGELAQARPFFERLRDEPGAADVARYGLGRIAAAAGDHRAAITLFEEALASQPEVAELHQQLGLAYRALGDRDAARRHLGAQVGHSLWFADPLREAIEVEVARVHIDRGYEAWEAGDLEASAKAYEQAVAAAPRNADYRLTYGSALARLGDLDGAVAAFTQAVELEPENPKAHYRLALARSDRDGLDEAAERHLRTAIALVPSFKEAHLALALALERAGRLDEAKEHFQAVLAIDPEDHQARVHWARQLLRRGEVGEAIADLERVLAAAPADADALLALGRARALQGDPQAAAVLYRQIIDLGETSPAARAAAHLRLGVQDEQSGDLAAAIEHYTSAVALTPNGTGTRRSLAAGLARAGRFAAAAEQLAAVAERAPDDPASYTHWAVTLAQDGRVAEARRVLERGHERLPAAEELTLALVQLLVTGPDPAARDAQKAVAIARQAHTAHPTPRHIEILALALAAAGDPAEAATWQRRLVTAAEQAGVDAATLASLQARLADYEQAAGAQR